MFKSKSTQNSSQIKSIGKTCFLGLAATEGIQNIGPGNSQKKFQSRLKKSGWFVEASQRRIAGLIY